MSDTFTCSGCKGQYSIEDKCVNTVCENCYDIHTNVVKDLNKTENTKEYSYRAFLNKDIKLTASVSWLVSPVSSPADPTVTGYFTVRDCNRTTTLDFYSRNDKEASAALEKIQELKKAVESFEKTLQRELKKGFKF